MARAVKGSKPLSWAFPEPSLVSGSSGSGGERLDLNNLLYQRQFHHTNKTTAAKPVAQAETVFKATQPPSVSANEKQGGPPTREYRENEERRIEQAIERQKRQRLERDATLANPPIKQHKHRDRPSKERIPATV